MRQKSEFPPFTCPPKSKQNLCHWKTDATHNNIYNKHQSLTHWRFNRGFPAPNTPTPPPPPPSQVDGFRRLMGGLFTAHLKQESRMKRRWRAGSRLLSSSAGEEEGGEASHSIVTLVLCSVTLQSVSHCKASHCRVSHSIVPHYYCVTPQSVTLQSVTYTGSVSAA